MRTPGKAATPCPIHLAEQVTYDLKVPYAQLYFPIPEIVCGCVVQDEVDVFLDHGKRFLIVGSRYYRTYFYTGSRADLDIFKCIEKIKNASP